MPALLEATLTTEDVRPRGLLGVPLHGLLFSALERVSVSLSTRIHSSEVKAFRIGQSRWSDDEDISRLRFQIGVLDDALLAPLLEALAPGSLHGTEDATLRGAVEECFVAVSETYETMYARHANGVIGREIGMAFLTPTTFRATDLDMPFPVPKTVFYGLQRRWEHFSDLHFGPELNDWIGRAVRVRDFHLRPRSVYFKGMHGASITACTGEVTFQFARPGDVEPTFVRLLADYANFAGVGYKTAFGLGHVEASGWHQGGAV